MALHVGVAPELAQAPFFGAYGGSAYGGSGSAYGMPFAQAYPPSVSRQVSAGFQVQPYPLIQDNARYQDSARRTAPSLRATRPARPGTAALSPQELAPCEVARGGVRLLLQLEDDCGTVEAWGVYDLDEDCHSFCERQMRAAGMRQPDGPTYLLAIRRSLHQVCRRTSTGARSPMRGAAAGESPERPAWRTHECQGRNLAELGIRSGDRVSIAVDPRSWPTIQPVYWQDCAQDAYGNAGIVEMQGWRAEKTRLDKPDTSRPDLRLPRPRPMLDAATPLAPKPPGVDDPTWTWGPVGPRRTPRASGSAVEADLSRSGAGSRRARSLDRRLDLLDRRLDRRKGHSVVSPPSSRPWR